jgi:hypothetical protein
MAALASVRAVLLLSLVRARRLTRRTSRQGDYAAQRDAGSYDYTDSKNDGADTALFCRSNRNSGRLSCGHAANLWRFRRSRTNRSRRLLGLVLSLRLR